MLDSIEKKDILLRCKSVATTALKDNDDGVADIAELADACIEALAVDVRKTDAATLYRQHLSGSLAHLLVSV